VGVKRFLVGAAMLLAVFSVDGRAAEHAVSTVAELTKAVASAAPGDVITIQPGRYEIRRINFGKPGTAAAPIVLRAEKLGSVLIEAQGSEAFSISESDWIFENLVMRGSPTSEHAFHIVRKASRTILRNNFLVDFDSVVKANGGMVGDERFYPNDVLIEGNILLNTTLRSGFAPVTPIDQVGGENWIIRGNFIADFGKAKSRFPSYGAFFKGNSRGGVMERNLIACEWRVPGGLAVRVGMSLGGGGTGESFCRADDCSVESRSETLQSNIIMNCSEDVGIYLNKASEAKIVDNTFYNSYGIDVRFPVSSAHVSGNILSGGARTRNGGTLDFGDNHQLSTKYGLIVHQGFVFLEGKVTGASAKYPTIFWPVVTDWIAGPRGPIKLADGITGRSFIGRGTGAAQDLFVNPEGFDFTLHGALPKRSERAVSTVDFCGRPRDSSRPSYGAIEYAAGPCDVSVLPRKADELLKMLPER